MSNMSTKTATKEQLLAAVTAQKSGRSAWARGVKEYALELVESLNDDADLSNETLLQKALFNGASSWQQYSEGGCSLIYNADIAERLCSPSELKRCKGGERAPSGRETWLDCQSRALWQAHKVVEKAWRELKGGAE